VLAVVLERFAGGRIEGGNVAAAVAAASDDKVSNREQDDTAAADSAAADMTCRCCCGCGCCDDRGGPADEECFLLSNQISLLLLSFSRLLELAGRLLLPCTAVAAEEFSLQVKLMLLWPLPDLISSLAHMPSGMECYHLECNVIIWTQCYHLGRNVIIWDEMLSSGANVVIWDEMLSSGMQCYHLELM
jgi:hypothetical protein